MRLFGMFAALALALAAAGANADLVVVSSSDPALPPGEVVADNQPLTLADRVRVTLVAADGKTTRLEGPYAGIPGGGRTRSAESDDGLVGQLSRLLEGRARRTPTLGAVRALGSQRTPPSPWDIQISRPGTWCIQADTPVMLGRSRATANDTLRVTAEASGAAEDVRWPKGERRVAWPASVPIDDGATYGLRLVAANTYAFVRITVVPGTLRTDAHRAAWMADRGCQDQAVALLESL